MKELLKKTWKKFKLDIILLNIILFIIVIIFKNEINKSIILSISSEIIILIVMITIVLLEDKLLNKYGSKKIELENTENSINAKKNEFTKRHFEWTKLSAEEKVKFKDYCDKKFGETNTYVENGEPLYFDKDHHLIDLKIVLDLFFTNNLN